MQIKSLKKDPSLKARESLEQLNVQDNISEKADKITDAVDLMIQINNYGKRCFERISIQEKKGADL